MIDTKWTDSRTGVVYTIANTLKGYVDLDNGFGLTVRVSSANFTEHFTEVIKVSDVATRAVERNLHKWHYTDMAKASWANGEVWEHLPSTSVRSFTDAAQDWLRDKSELRTSTIERADYTAIFRRLYLTPAEQPQPAPVLAPARPRDPKTGRYIKAPVVLDHSAYCIRCQRDDLHRRTLCDREAIVDNGAVRTVTARYEGRCIRCCNHNHA